MSDAKRIAELNNRFSQRETEELLVILESEGQSEWTAEALEAAKQVLVTRGFDLATFYRGKAEKQERLQIAQQHLEQAVTYEQENLLKEALAECNTALEIESEFAGAYNFRGVILEQLGRRDEALADYKRAIELDPNFEEAHGNLLELKAEINAPEQKRIISETLRIVGWSVLGFAVVFPLAFVILGYFAQSLMNSAPELFYVWISPLIFAVAFSLSVGWLAYKSKTGRSPTRFMLFGFVGAVGVEIFLPRLISGLGLSQFILTAVGSNFSGGYQIVIGCLLGLALELAQWRRGRFGWLVLASGIGFSFKHWAEFTLVFLLTVQMRGPDFGLDRSADQMAFLIASLVSGGLVGGFAGGLLGLALRLSDISLESWGKFFNFKAFGVSETPKV